MRIASHGCCFAWFVFIAAVCYSPAQEKVTPSTPNVFIRIAADASNLAAPTAKPWHIKARYQQFKPDGSVEFEGLMEAWWASEDKFKISYTRSNFTQTIYQNSSDAYFVGESIWPSAPEYDVSALLLHPLPDEKSIGESFFSTKDVSAGTAKLQCITKGLKNPGIRISLDGQAYCFAGDLPAIRLFQDTNGARTSFNNIVPVNGQYVSRQIRSTKPPGTPYINIDVDKAEPLASADEASITAPPDAREVQKKINFSAEIIPGKRAGGDRPEYPYEARSQHVTGNVILDCLISKEGAVTNLTVVSGPAILQSAAFNAVKTWRYEPYTRAGLPVEVGVQIQVSFAMGPAN